MRDKYADLISLYAIWDYHSHPRTDTPWTWPVHGQWGGTCQHMWDHAGKKRQKSPLLSARSLLVGWHSELLLDIPPPEQHAARETPSHVAWRGLSMLCHHSVLYCVPDSGRTSARNCRQWGNRVQLYGPSFRLPSPGVQRVTSWVEVSVNTLSLHCARWLTVYPTFHSLLGGRWRQSGSL